MSPGEVDVALRLAAAVGLGALVGLDRGPRLEVRLRVLQSLEWWSLGWLHMVFMVHELPA
ncbi:hypothetical protein [Candidatus Poriferisocius sp.]|uniref:hypothetical protein n=1 Tax=Candidatus Poriferisocius sp. TaxID=3101276 RepID=UPI003B010604